KKVNDTYGHLAGDAVLVHFAQLAQQAVRAEDLFARYGGEEFVVLARATPEAEAYQLAERLRTMVAEAARTYEERVIPITVSGGVASFPQVPASNPLELVGHADQALYAAKREGRNRIIPISQLRRCSESAPAVRGISVRAQ